MPSNPPLARPGRGGGFSFASLLQGTGQPSAPPSVAVGCPFLYDNRLSSRFRNEMRAFRDGRFPAAPLPVVSRPLTAPFGRRRPLVIHTGPKQKHQVRWLRGSRPILSYCATPSAKLRPTTSAIRSLCSRLPDTVRPSLDDIHVTEPVLWTGPLTYCHVCGMPFPLQTGVPFHGTQ